MIEYIGYEKKEISPINLFPGTNGSVRQNFGTVKLNISAVNMDVVQVVGDESTFIQTIDKKIFNVGRDISSSGGNGSDVLRKVPSVDVDIDGVVSIAGDANVTILVDGKRSGKTGSGRRGEVDNIAASMIEKIEVITNPSAKYDPDGVGGIINIVLKRGSFDGFNGTVSSLQGEYNKQNYNGNLNYRTDNINLFTNLNYSTGDRVGDGRREFAYKYLTADEGISNTDSVYTNTKRVKTPKDFGLRLGGDYYPSKSSTFGYTFDISQHRETERNEFDYEINTINPNLEGVLITNETDDGTHMDHVLSYENKYDSKAQLLKAFVSYSYETDDILESGEMNSEYGANAFGRLTEAFEDIYAAYLVTRYNFTDRFGFKFGARTEQVETIAKLDKKVVQDIDTSNVLTQLFDDGILESPFNKNYFKIYPSAFLIYKLTERQTIQFGYSKKVNRPTRRTISPYPNNTQDITRLRNGNPFLKPEYSDVMELSFSSNTRKLNLNLSTSYKNTKDVIMGMGLEC